MGVSNPAPTDYIGVHGVDYPISTAVQRGMKDTLGTTTFREIFIGPDGVIS